MQGAIWCRGTSDKPAKPARIAATSGLITRAPTDDERPTDGERPIGKRSYTGSLQGSIVKMNADCIATRERRNTAWSAYMTHVE